MSEKILVVDDDEEFANLLGLLLSRKGYQTEVAYGGAMALELAAKVSPAVIVQDYMLPDYRGMDLLKEFKERFPDVYVIIITARGNEEVAVELLKSGASDYLKKPFESEKLLKTVENVLRLRSSESDRDRLNRDLLQQNQELMALNALSTALTSAMSPAEKYKSAAGIILKNMRVDAVNLFDFDAAGRTLRLIASECRDMAGFDGCVLKGDTGLASYVAEIKKSAVVVDFRDEKRFKVPEELHDRGITSALATPLMVRGSVKGVLAVYTKVTRSFPAFEMKLVNSFANLIAMDMDSEQTTGALERMRRKWQASFDAVPDSVTVQDANHVIIIANKAAAELAGSTVNDLIGQTCCWVFHDRKTPIDDCPVDEAIATKKPVTREVSLEKPKGTFRIWAEPILDAEGNIEMVVEYARKIG